MKSETVKKAEIITSMFAMYGAASDGERIAGYVKIFKDIPAELLKAACKKIVLQNKFLPSVSEIVEAMRSLVGDVVEEKRVKPWSEAQKEISQGLSRAWFHGCLGEIPPDHPDYGKSCEPMWSTPEIKATVESYGLYNIGWSMVSDMPIVWAQLRKIYETVCQRKADEKINRYVAGDNAGRLAEMVKGISGKMLLEIGNRKE